MIIVKVKLFANLRNYFPDLGLGKSLDVQVESNTTIARLYEILEIPAEEIKLAYVNGIYCETDYKLKDGDEIGIFPPIGGGSQ